MWRTVKLLIAFQGTHYAGWQSQRNNKTLQEIFETNLAKILKEKTVLHGCSRTDAGVHARGFAAHFKTKTVLNDAKIKDALNHYLPKDVVVLSAKTVSDSFHARFDARSKTYEYEIWNSRTRPVFDKAPFVLWIKQKLDLKRMRRAATFLVGTHDFNAFRDSGEEERRTVKTIRRILISRQSHSITIKITGDGFLKHMVRVIVGTLIQVGCKKTDPETVVTILKSKDRRQAGPTARPLGLILLKVCY